MRHLRLLTKVILLSALTLAFSCSFPEEQPEDMQNTEPNPPEFACFRIVTLASDDTKHSVGDMACGLDANDDYDGDGIPNAYDGAKGEFAGDSGSFASQDSEGCYEIANIYQLQAIMSFQGDISLSERLSASYRLVSNIDASVTQETNYDSDFDSSSAPAGEGFLPIGSLNGASACTNTGAACFVGVFDGNNYSISNLYINGSAKTLGLFGTAGDIPGSDMRILNVGLVDLNVSSTGLYTSRIGGLAGYLSEGEITNSYVTGTVSSGDTSDYVGGLAAHNFLGNITNSYTASNVYGGAGADNVGGLVGYNVRGNITNSYAAGNMDGGDDNDNVGGLVAYNINGSIANSYALGNTVGGAGNDRVGGLAGQHRRIFLTSSITNSYAAGNVDGGDDNDDVGGLVGYSTANIANSYAAGNVDGGDDNDDVGGLVGYAYGNVTGKITGTNFYVNGTDWEGDGTACPTGAVCQQESLQNILDALFGAASITAPLGMGWSESEWTNSGNTHPCIASIDFGRGGCPL